MANEIILLDTDFLIEYIYKNEEAVNTINGLPNAFIVIGATVVAEIVKGTINKIHLQKTLKEINSLHVINIDESISEAALQLLITYHLSKSAAFNDSLLAATAIKYGCKLATCNKKHFEYIPNLQLLQHNVIPKRKSFFDF
ncbi:MAG: PIN domain-containing protein [Chitinophagales bacterium]|nr:PIN domain-containing protein [Chitinophagales bacterium]